MHTEPESSAQEEAEMSNGRHSYVAFYPSDWLGGTARLPRLHKSVFFDICCYIWDTNEPCPPIEVQVMVADLPNGREIVDQLVALGKLDRHADGSLSNARALVEAGKSQSLWEAQSGGGKRARSKSAAESDEKPAEITPAKRPGKRPAKSDPSVIPENQNQNQNQKGVNPLTPYSPPDNPFAGEAWDGWIAMRARKKKLPTERAIQLSIDKLRELKAAGQDPDAVLDQSTLNGWTGLFPLKQDRSSGKQSGWA